MTIRGVAHRGYSARHPENTLTAFQAAADLSFSHVEFDVRLTRDRHPVILHDADLSRVAGRPVDLGDLTLAQVQRIELPGGEHVPTLDETLRLLAGGPELLVELKQRNGAYPGLEEITLEALRRTGTLDQAIVISFDPYALAETRRLDADVRLGLTSADLVPHAFGLLTVLRCSLLGMPMAKITPSYVQAVADLGVIPGPWIVDTQEDMDTILRDYPDTLITTNECERWAAAVGRGPRPA